MQVLFVVFFFPQLIILLYGFYSLVSAVAEIQEILFWK